ncbi:MAG: hypothetical protein DMG97_13385 [Acidobacteria bacterium]|nr:MAG: hypothetical protein DMG97_13385 [Acidobacteriota bacterium]
MLGKLQATGNGPSMELWFETPQPEDLFAPLVHSAAKLFAEADRNVFENVDIAFCISYDTSKKGTRRWCPSHAPMRWVDVNLFEMEEVRQRTSRRWVERRRSGKYPKRGARRHRHIWDRYETPR